jgi:hypothetical protein
MGAAGAIVYVLSLATAPWVVDRPVTQWVRKTVGRKAGREDRFQLSGAEWTAEDDALLRSLIGSGKPSRAVALEMKRTVGGIPREDRQAGPSEQPSLRSID